MNTLLEGQQLNIPAIKAREAKVITTPVTSTTHAMAMEHKEEIELLCKEKTQGKLVFTPEGKETPIDNAILNKRVNTVLKKVSALLNKRITLSYWKDHKSI